MMKFQITSMTPEERLYAYSQSSKIEGQTGCIGYLRGDFLALEKSFILPGSTAERNIRTMSSRQSLMRWSTPCGKRDGLLCSRASMSRFCYQHPEAEFEGELLHRIWV